MGIDYMPEIEKYKYDSIIVRRIEELYDLPDDGENSTDAVVLYHSEGAQLFNQLKNLQGVKKPFRIFVFGNFVADFSLNYWNHTVIAHTIKYTPFNLFSVDSYVCVGINELQKRKEPYEKTHSCVGMYYGHRVARDYLWTLLCENNLQEGVVYHSMAKEETLYKKNATEESFSYIGKQNYYERYLNNIPPLVENGFSLLVEYANDTINHLSKGLFDIVSDTGFCENLEVKVATLTEKSMFPFYSHCIPLLLQHNSLEAKEYLKSIGFDMFEEVIPEKFYYIRDEDKPDMVIDIVNKFKDGYQGFYIENYDRFKSNEQLALDYRYKHKEGIDDIISFLDKYNVNIDKEKLKHIWFNDEWNG